MNWQIMTAVLAFLFMGRGALFVLGIAIGGMLTVRFDAVEEVMTVALGWWLTVVTLVVG